MLSATGTSGVCVSVGASCERRSESNRTEGLTVCQIFFAWALAFSHQFGDYECVRNVAPSHLSPHSGVTLKPAASPPAAGLFFWPLASDVGSIGAPSSIVSDALVRDHIVVEVSVEADSVVSVASRVCSST